MKTSDPAWDEPRGWPTRRQLLIGGAASTGLGLVGLGSGLAGQEQSEDASGPEVPQSSPPALAASAGFTDLVFDDQFDTATIDLSGKGGAGFKWYTDLPFSWGRVAADEFSIADSVLTLNPRVERANWTLATVSAATGHGTAFTRGLFQARLKFSRPVVAKPSGWPAFWSISREHMVDGLAPSWSELDFFEVEGSNQRRAPKVIGTVHDWRAKEPRHVQNPNNVSSHRADYDRWHLAECLWTSGAICWFLNGKQIAEVAYGRAATRPVPDAPAAAAASAFRTMDRPGEGMTMVIGTGPGWPLHLDWVRVWA
ncbi:MAG TPA: family 16 glycosylhydrolase [Candidatus Luteococcus avicola]|nr:family 16 glycosylhydrolase [Candidatus Luteococcus avicola]